MQGSGLPHAAFSSLNASAAALCRRFQVGMAPKIFSRTFLIRNNTDNQVHYAKRSEWTPRRPDLILRVGAGTDAPIVAVSHLSCFSRGPMQIGLGDPAAPGAVQWDEMTSALAKKFKYTWHTVIASVDGSRRTLAWKRTRSVAVEGMTIPRLTARNFKLVDEGTGEILAVFTAERGLHKLGVLEVKAGFGERFYQMVLMACLSVYEYDRRSF
ncbi:hypothetical protein ACJ41O_006704 [Fusarium nematophilum]